MNKGHWTDVGSFIDACIGPNNVVCASIVDDELASKGLSFTKVAALSQDNWLDGGSFKWPVIANTRCEIPLPQYAIIGAHGQVQFVGGGDIHEEVIEDETSSSAKYGQINGAKSIEGYLYVCGMNRQVYKRLDRNEWKSIFVDPIKIDGVSGFNSIDGFSQNEIYTVGWEGEIWQYNGTDWVSRDAQTEEILTDVVCGSDGKVYILSRGRKLIVGRNEIWKTFELDIPTDILSIAWAHNRLYACSSRQVFEWNGTTLNPLPTADDNPRSIHKLNSLGGALCVIGAKDLFAFDDGAWTRID